MTGDAKWYEAAMVVGITNALNVVADSLTAARGLGAVMPGLRGTGPGFGASDSALDASGPGVRETHGAAETAAVFADIRAFYARVDVPVAFELLAPEPGYLADVWAATRHAFSDHELPRRLKEALAFAVSVTTRSAFGTAFHLGEMRRLGVGDRGVMEVLGVTQMFSSYTKIADTLQLEADMGEIAPVDESPAPG
jgi:alkylhydroperoxidase/carboxymuconolactone decarboxylase family protein YurZ